MDPTGQVLVGLDPELFKCLTWTNSQRAIKTSLHTSLPTLSAQIHLDSKLQPLHLNRNYFTFKLNFSNNFIKQSCVCQLDIQPGGLGATTEFIITDLVLSLDQPKDGLSKVRTFLESCSDQDRIRRRGTEPIVKFFKERFHSSLDPLRVRMNTIGSGASPLDEARPG